VICWQYGKGNIQVSKMHIDGVKQMVAIRGGIKAVRSTSPLTARMIPWYDILEAYFRALLLTNSLRVSMLVMGSPQFATQDDFGVGDGIGMIPQWQPVYSPNQSDLSHLNFGNLDLDPATIDILTRLRNIFRQSQLSGLSNTDLHDLTCFVIHKLLLLPTLPAGGSSGSEIISQCIRYATTLYMFIIHGPTYYSHASVLNTISLQLKAIFEPLVLFIGIHDPLAVWLLYVGMVATNGTVEEQWFMDQARAVMVTLGLQSWTDIRIRLESVLWVEIYQGELFRQKWEKLLAAMIQE
jgi:hypothetical protein